MVFIKKILLGVVLLFISGESLLSQGYSAMTYNIRYSTPNDGENWWEFRKEWVADVINFYEPDILGIQEGLHHQVSFLDSVLNRYAFVGVGRDDANQAGEYAAIFYNSQNLEVIDHGTFWLSETPEEPSYGWGANFRRISTWAKFKSKENDQRFWVFNAHFDHETPLARLNGMKLILDQIKEWNIEDFPVIVMGDFNAIPDAPPIKLLSSEMKDSKYVAEFTPIGPEGTYNGFDTKHPLDQRIDYIFVDDQIKVQKYAVISETRENRTPSDHLPVYIEFRLE